MQKIYIKEEREGSFMLEFNKWVVELLKEFL
jgi:hypothetical protein